jgi:hypothetical protein
MTLIGESDVVPPLIEHQPGQMAACHFAGEAVPGEKTAQR